ncbi:MAG: twin-arginine translocase subunit TatB [Chloroflexi bacterium]|nr:twin-arginine translocase subunit TatB [Chloroflexota bacterium]
MDFLGLGMGEIILIIIVALIIFGPSKIPEMARQAGKLMRTLKQTSSELTTQIQKELEEEEKAHLASSITASQKPTQPAPPQPPPLEVPKTGAAKQAGPAGGETLTTK